MTVRQPAQRRLTVPALAALLALTALLLLAGVAAAQEPDGGEPDAVLAVMGTAFTYQGRLTDAGSPATGVYDFQFRLYSAAASGSQIGATQPVDDAAVAGGLFTATLDFGASAFEGLARWLEIDVKHDADGSYTTLSPRVALSPAPHALALPGFYTQQTTSTPNLIGGYINNSVTGSVYGATISGGGSGSGWHRVTDNYGTIGGGHENQAGDNAGTHYDSINATVSGGQDNKASAAFATVSGGDSNEASGDRSTIGGGGHNTTAGNYATIGGGDHNTASGDYATTGGGVHNTTTGNYATIGGGNYNTASGDDAAIGGGYLNTASGDSSTIGGGDDNTASNGETTISGGWANTASGNHATIGGGFNNIASGGNSTVSGGALAAASHFGEMAYASGAFVGPGDAQTSLYVLRRETGDATQTELFLDGTNDRITLPADRVMTFDILVVASHRFGGGSSAGYQVAGVIRNIGGTTAFVGTPLVTVLGENVAGWDIQVEASDALDALVIKVLGSAGTTIRWVASVRTVELAR